MSKQHESVHLPNGQVVTVTPVFGGLFFESQELNIHKSAFPAGWTIILQSEEYANDDDVAPTTEGTSQTEEPRRHNVRRYRQPTLHGDSLYISSISNPSSTDFRPATSPTRATAAMLWVTLYWYFHQTEPSPYLTTEASKDTPEAGKPRGDWRIRIRREGVFRSNYLLQKLERMGLVSSEESYVGTNPDEAQQGWSHMFVSRRAFWLLSARLFLFTLSPANTGRAGSRPSSPIRHLESTQNLSGDFKRLTIQPVIGPFTSGSHLPTYFPPPPLQYIMSNGVRHPVRPKPPRQGEMFYVRHIPSVGEHLSFRVASLSESPIRYTGPTAVNAEQTMQSPETNTMNMSDLDLLHKWMNEPRVSAFWGCSGPKSTQEKFLRSNLESRHSFPVIGCWNGKPFGYFEIYWVKEDILGRHLDSNEVDDFDRGVHVLVGEQEFRGIHRLRCWISALAHYALLHDYRTNNVVLEPRVDNVRFIKHLEDCGFQKEKEITFPHKQSAFVRLRREVFDGPAL